MWDEEIIEQGETAREMALGLPDTLPERVYELADTIAADADNDYDRMKAFERYLEEFTYTKKPPQCPEGQEFTDYFLFESKSGYCTYFATALAVLGRCEGIPTRYVSGFMTPKTCKGRHANVSVTGNQAHAWTEAYIEHVGWVRFDATPGYGEVQEDRWKPIQVTDTGQMDKPDIEEVEATESEVSGETDAQKKSAGWYAKTLLEAAGLLLAGCLLAVLGIVGLRKLLWRRKYADADIPEKVRIQLKCLLKLGRLQGEPIAEGETLQAYQRRTQKIKDMAEYSFADACDLYEGVRFGAKSVSPEEMQKLVTYTKNVERAYLAECGVLKKIVYFII